LKTRCRLDLGPRLSVLFLHRERERESRRDTILDRMSQITPFKP